MHPSLLRPLLIALLLVPAYLIAFLAPVVGGFLDDGIYIATAKSVAQGNGYHIASLPGAPAQTKYPFVFPVILAAVWRLFPGFPQNSFALKTVPFLFGMLWAWTVWKLFRQRAGREGAAWLCVLTLAMPWTVFLSTSLLSESLFMFLTWWALYSMQDDASPLTNRRVLLAAALAGAAFLTRTSGLALMVAGVLTLAMQRRWKQSAIFAVTAFACFAAWAGWQAINPAPADPALAYYSKANYAQWNLVNNFDAAQKFAIIWQNLVTALFGPAAFLGMSGHPITLLVSAPLCLIALRGWWIAYRTEPRILPVWSAIYLALIMNWAWPPSRFLVILAPLFFYYLWLALRLPRTLTAACLAVAFISCGWGLYAQARETSSGGLSTLPGVQSDDYRSLAAMLRELGRRAPADAVLAGNIDSMYSLYSGRTALRPYAENPYLLHYAGEPERNPLGTPYELMLRLKHYRVTYLVIDQARSFEESRWLKALADELEQKKPGSFTIEAQSADQRIRIYRVHPELWHDSDGDPASFLLEPSPG